MTRTIITIGNPDDGHTVELKGDVRAAEAIHRAKHIVRAQTRLDQTERGYLISCINNGNYAITHETTE